MALGRVAGMWRYPVKSMQGEGLEAAQVSESGIAGDRAYALVETATGKIASAKNPRKWPGLLRSSAVFLEAPSGGGIPPVRVTLPDGTALASNERGFDERASKILGRGVVLTSAPVESSVLEEYWPDIDGLAHRETVTDEAISARHAVPLVFRFFGDSPGHDIHACGVEPRPSGGPFRALPVSTQPADLGRGRRVCGERLGGPPGSHRGGCGAGYRDPLRPMRDDDSAAARPAARFRDPGHGRAPQYRHDCAVRYGDAERGSVREGGPRGRHTAGRCGYVGGLD